MSLSSLKVLIADADPVLRETLSGHLKAAGHQVTEASDGAQVRNLLRSDCPHVLVADWELPGLGALELCQAVRHENTPHFVSVQLLIGCKGSAEKISALEAGADVVLEKPVEHRELLAGLRSVATRLEYEQRLHVNAANDPLTGIPNRRSFLSQLEQEWARAARYRLSLSCLMIDLDFFKKLNDTYGHATGDACIRTVARLISENTRRSDHYCRYGGEEFCVLLPETNEEGATVWAERIRKIISETVIDAGEDSKQITASIGVAERLEDTESLEVLIDYADQALLVAKRSGRNRVVRFRSLTDLALDEAAGLIESGGCLDGVKARDVMSAPIICLHHDETNLAAADFLLRKRLNSVPVVDAAGNLVGIISERDLMGQVPSDNFWRAPVRDVMSTSVVVYNEETPVREIWDFLCRVAVRRVVIVNDRKPTGVISRGSMLRWFHEHSKIASP